MLHASDHFVPMLEAGELNMDQVNRLLNIFVSENWQSHQTYNGFIRGFGNQFEEATVPQSIEFIKLMVEAGLNQIDILDAIIDKTTESFDTGRRLND